VTVHRTEYRAWCFVCTCEVSLSDDLTTHIKTVLYIIRICANTRKVLRNSLILYKNYKKLKPIMIRGIHRCYSTDVVLLLLLMCKALCKRASTSHLFLVCLCCGVVRLFPGMNICCSGCLYIRLMVCVFLSAWGVVGTYGSITVNCTLSKQHASLWVLIRLSQ
jgi:hypothetical protein